jgi:hypothetical protein
MPEHDMTPTAVPPGHPGASSQPAGDDGAPDPIRRALAEAELLRARIDQLQRAGLCNCPAVEPAWA